MHGDLSLARYRPRLAPVWLSDLALLLAIVVLATFGGGCAPMSEIEKESAQWSAAMSRENWKLCEQAYKQAARPTIHRDHLHNPRLKVPLWAIRRDLADNDCRMILGPYWAD